jgi:hypothetical protein
MKKLIILILCNIIVSNIFVTSAQSNKGQQTDFSGKCLIPYDPVPWYDYTPLIPMAATYVVVSNMQVPVYDAYHAPVPQSYAVYRYRQQFTVFATGMLVTAATFIVKEHLVKKKAGIMKFKMQKPFPFLHSWKKI